MACDALSAAALRRGASEPCKDGVSAAGVMHASFGFTDATELPPTAWLMLHASGGPSAELSLRMRFCLLARPDRGCSSSLSVACGAGEVQRCDPRLCLVPPVCCSRFCPSFPCARATEAAALSRLSLGMRRRVFVKTG